MYPQEAVEPVNQVWARDFDIRISDLLLEIIYLKICTTHPRHLFPRSPMTSDRALLQKYLR